MDSLSVIDGVKSGLKDVGGQLIGTIAQSAEEKVDSRLDAMTETINKDAERIITEIFELSFYLKIGIILFSILMIIIMMKTCCEGLVLISKMTRPTPSNHSKHEREPFSL